MWYIALPALAGQVSEEVCVSEQRSASSIEVPPVPDTITRVRSALSETETTPLPPVGAPDLLAALDAPDLPDAPGAQGFGFGAAAVLDPLDPERGWLVVAGQGVDAGLVPLRLTFVIDTSPSMGAVFTRGLPPLQDEVPDGSYRAVSRLTLARAILVRLTERLPSRAVVAVVATDAGRAKVLLPPTPIRHQSRIKQAILSAQSVAVGPQSLATIGDVALHGGDPCADTRVLVLTDEHARISMNIVAAQDAVTSWRQDGATTWTMSLGTLGAPVPEAQALTALGGGIHLRADTASDGVEQLSHALRASGVVARDFSVEIQPDPQRVRAIRRVDGGSDGPWAIPAVEASAFLQSVYELSLVPEAPPGPAAHLRWSVASAAPGEWQAGAGFELPLITMDESPEWVRHRVVATTVAEAFQSNGEWSGVWRMSDAASGHRGFARELSAWAFHMAHPDGVVHGSLPFLNPDPP